MAKISVTKYSFVSFRSQIFIHNFFEKNVFKVYCCFHCFCAFGELKNQKNLNVKFEALLLAKKKEHLRLHLLPCIVHLAEHLSSESSRMELFYEHSAANKSAFYLYCTIEQWVSVPWVSRSSPSKRECFLYNTTLLFIFRPGFETRWMEWKY